MKPSEKWEFDRGDIISRPGTLRKWLVTGFIGVDYVIGVSRSSYNLRCIDGSGCLGSGDGYVKDYCERDCVKVGNWDFELEREADDGEK